MLRIERECEREQEKSSDRIVGAAEELAEWHRLQQKILNKPGIPPKKGLPHHHKVSSWQ